jgi:cytochrome c-type biogenesis protein CcmH/NrfF
MLGKALYDHYDHVDMFTWVLFSAFILFIFLVMLIVKRYKLRRTEEIDALLAEREHGAEL